MTETIAPLRARVRLESPARTPDDIGGAALGWADEGEAWAMIEAGAAALGQAYDTARARTVMRATIRARADVRAGWRVAWGARRFAVDAVEDEGAARIVLICTEEVL